MKKVMLVVLTLMVFGVITIAPLVAQDQGTSAAPAKAEHAKAASESNPGMWSRKPETLSGTISSVDAEKKLVSVTANNVPYSFKVEGTKIQVGGKRGKLSDLQTGAQASVTFVATRTGDMAKSIQVQ